MDTSNENKYYINGKETGGYLEINHELCEQDKVYENYEITSIRKNGHEPRCIGGTITTQLYKLIIEKDGIESELELGSRDSEKLAYYTNMYYHNTPDDIDLPKVVSFTWIRMKTKRGNTYLDLNILWNLVPVKKITES